MQNFTFKPTKLQIVNCSKLNLKLVLLIFSIFVFGNGLFAQIPANIQTNNNSEEYVPDEIIIQFKSSVANSVQSAVSRNSSQTGLPEIDKLNRKYGVSKIIKAFQFKENASNARQQAADKFGLSRTFILKVENNTNIEALLKEYNANEDVQYAEPNGLVQAHDIPSSDPSGPSISRA